MFKSYLNLIWINIFFFFFFCKYFVLSGFRHEKLLSFNERSLYFPSTLPPKIP